MVALMRVLRRFNLDFIGFSASAVCAVHCMVVPFLFLFGAVGPFHLVHNHVVENVILVISALIGISSFLPSMMYTHRRRTPLLLFLLGVSAIVVGRFPVPLLWESFLTTAGASLIAFAHYHNWKLCRTCAVHASKK